MIYDYFRVTGAQDSVENYADLFSLRNDDIQEFVSKWDGILLSVTKIPHDDILEGLYKLRIRESEKLKTVLELYDLEIHQKKLGPVEFTEAKRAQAACHKVRLGEVSRARQCLTGAVLAEGTDHTFRLQDRRPQVVSTPVPAEPDRPIQLDRKASVEYTFIQKRFHPLTRSSKHTFIQ